MQYVETGIRYHSCFFASSAMRHSKFKQTYQYYVYILAQCSHIIKIFGFLQNKIIELCLTKRYWRSVQFLCCLFYKILTFILKAPDLAILKGSVICCTISTVSAYVTFYKVWYRSLSQSNFFRDSTITADTIGLRPCLIYVNDKCHYVCFSFSYIQNRLLLLRAAAWLFSGCSVFSSYHRNYTGVHL